MNRAADWLLVAVFVLTCLTAFDGSIALLVRWVGRHIPGVDAMAILLAGVPAFLAALVITSVCFKDRATGLGVGYYLLGDSPNHRSRRVNEHPPYDEIDCSTSDPGVAALLPDGDHVAVETAAH